MQIANPGEVGKEGQVSDIETEADRAHLQSPLDDLGRRRVAVAGPPQSTLGLDCRNE